MAHRRTFSAEYNRKAVPWRCSTRPVSVSVKSRRTWGLGRRFWDAGDEDDARSRSRRFRTMGGRADSASSGVCPRHEGAGCFARSGSVLRERIAMQYRMIQRCRPAFPIRRMCHCLRVSPPGTMAG